jgi:UDP-N-acetylglucosamine acyltransferase
MPLIHSTAIVHPSAKIAQGVVIDAYAFVGEHVTLDAGVHLKPHSFVEGHTMIGEGSIVYPFASVGSAPQDLKYKGEPTRLIIGKHTTIREHVTINTGTVQGGGVTTIGDHTLLMVGVHIGHDCHVGNHVIMANNATLGGHVVVEDHAVLGGLCAVHQFCRIGKLAMIGGMTGVEHDVIPYGMVTGNRATLKGLNLIGLERTGSVKAHIHELRAAYKELYGDHHSADVFSERLDRLKEAHPSNPLINDLVAFLESPTKRRFVGVG